MKACFTLKHLPGQHDQLSHGHKTKLDVSFSQNGDTLFIEHKREGNIWSWEL